MQVFYPLHYQILIISILNAYDRVIDFQERGILREADLQRKKQVSHIQLIFLLLQLRETILFLISVTVVIKSSLEYVVHPIQGNVEYSDNENRCTEDNPEGNDRDSKDLRNDLSVSVMYLEVFLIFSFLPESIGQRGRIFLNHVISCNLQKDSGIKSHKSSEGKGRLRKSSITPERSHVTQIKTANLRNAKSPMASCLRQDQKLTVIQEASADISKPKKVGKLHENGATAMSRAKTLTPSRMLSRGRRPLTIPKEPHFHSTHRPKSCTKNLAEQVPL